MGNKVTHAERKAAALASADKILSTAKTEGRDLTADEVGKVDALGAEAEQAQKDHDQEQAAIKAAGRIEALRRIPTEDGRKTDPASAEKVPPMVARLAIEDDPKRGYRSVADFAIDVFRGGPQETAHNDRLRLLAATGMSQGVMADGGFLVPPSFSTTIWDGLNKMPDNLMDLTDRYTVEGESLTFPANAETNRATGSRYGGIRGYWLAEAGQVTASKPTWRQVTLRPNQLGVLCYVTDKLLRNSPVALEQYLTRAATEEIAFLVNDAIINGTGTGQPLGILASASLISVTKETGQAATTIVKENMDKMWARLHARSWANARWFINQDTLPQLQALSATVGVGGMPVFLPPGGISASPYGTLYGRPVVPIEYAASLGTVGDIILADLSGYAFGTQGTVEQAMSMHLKFDYAETAFRFLFAVDGQPWLASALTPYKGTGNTQSTFVAVATRS